MNLQSTRLGYLGLEGSGSGAQHAEVEPPGKQGLDSTSHDRLPKLESVPSVHLHHTAEGEETTGLDDQSEGGCRLLGSLPTALRWFSTSLVVLSAAGSLLVVAKGTIAVPRETMVMWTSLESPLAADQVILMSFLR